MSSKEEIIYQEIYNIVKEAPRDQKPGFDMYYFEKDFLDADLTKFEQDEMLSRICSRVADDLNKELSIRGRYPSTYIFH